MSILIRRAAVAVAALLGALFAFGALVAILFELQGFGDRDGDPRVLYVIGLLFAFAVSVALPLLLWRTLLPRASGRFLVATAVGATAAVLVVLGVSLR